MPNRILKESIRVSKKINGLSDFEFRVWAYLITYVDDYGRGSADLDLLKGLVFPRRKRMTEADLKRAISSLAGMGCIRLYEVDGESYFCFPNWSEHQRIRNRVSKFPAPPDEQADGQDGKTAGFDNSPQLAADCGNSPQIAATRCNSPQLAADCRNLPQLAATCGLNTNTNTNPDPESELRIQNPNPNPDPTRARAREAADQSNFKKISFPCRDGSFEAAAPQLERYGELYPGVDVSGELLSALAWLEANPQRQKPKADMPRFLNGWLLNAKERQKAPPRQKTSERGEQSSFDYSKLDGVL